MDGTLVRLTGRKSRAMLGYLAATFAPEVGLAAYSAAISIADAGGLRPLAAHVLRSAARIYAATAQPEAARAALTRAEQIAETMRRPLVS